MLVNITHDTRGEHRRLVVAGLAYLTACAVLIALSIAMYQKVFTPVTHVTVEADRAGLQLARFGDVRIHGVLVGQVRSVTQNGHNAVIKLALRPSAAKHIPSNVSVQILPTTLFGQKFISFIDPTNPSTRPLRNGAVIPKSRVTTNVELQSILADLFPLLRSIRPADLDTTLYALSTMLSGQGTRMGETMSHLDQYLGAMQPHFPTVRRDLVSLARVSRAYSLAAPDLVRLLRNATTTARTVAAKQAELHTFFTDLTGLAGTGTQVLHENANGIIREGQLAVPLMKLLDTYSPEYTCLLKGTDRYTNRLNAIFAHSRVRQSMSFDAKQRGPYTAKDRPVYGEVGHGPWCLGLPVPPQPVPPQPMRDGTNSDGPDR